MNKNLLKNQTKFNKFSLKYPTNSIFPPKPTPQKNVKTREEPTKHFFFFYTHSRKTEEKLFYDMMLLNDKVMDGKHEMLILTYF